MGLIDTHCHLDSYERSGSLAAVLDRARAAGIESLVAIGTGADDWSLNRGFARSNPGFVHYTVGIHPCSVQEGWKAEFDSLEDFFSDGDGPRPAALGECGLDAFHLPKDADSAREAYARQRAAFEAHLLLARRLACPVVVHSRAAFADCVAMIDASGVDWSRVVFHCFSEGPAEIRELARRGGRGSFTGILTYKNADNVRAAASAQGIGRLMVETDAPYLAPVPHRGKPNEPGYVKHVAESAASLLGMPFAELAAATTANAKAFFSI